MLRRELEKLYSSLVGGKLTSKDLHGKSFEAWFVDSAESKLPLGRMRFKVFMNVICALFPIHYKIILKVLSENVFLTLTRLFSIDLFIHLLKYLQNMCENNVACGIKNKICCH